MQREIKELVQEIEYEKDELETEAFDIFCKHELGEMVRKQGLAKERYKGMKRQLKCITISQLRDKFLGSVYSTGGTYKDKIISELKDRQK